MARVLSRFRCSLKTFSSFNDWWCKSLPRHYSVYAPYYKNPVTDEKEIDKIIAEKHQEEILATYVKAAKNNETCSVFYNPDVELFVHFTMNHGKIQTARDVVKEAFTKVKHIQLRKYDKETDEEKKKNILINPLEVFLLAVKNVTPVLWYLKIKRSGTWYKIPVGISEDQARRRAMKWILEVSMDKPQTTPLEVQLAQELVAAAAYEGKSVAKKIEMHKLCEANRSYANYWWG